MKSCFCEGLLLRLLHRSFWAAWLTALVSFVTHEAMASDDYYRGKTVTAYVGYTPGGTNDIVTRALAQFIGRYLGGNPNVIVRNMPGAVTRTLAAYLYNIAPRDGTVFGNLDRQITMASLLDPSIKEPFDIPKFTWLGSPFQETLTCVTWHTSPVQTLTDLRTKQFIVASPGANSGESFTEQILNTLVGANIKSVHGYPGSSQMFLALQRGEAHGRCGLGWESAKACCSHWLNSGELKVLIQLSVKPNAELIGVPSLADVPMADIDRQALGLIYSSQQMGRPFAAPPDMPEERRLALRKAFDDTLNDQEFIATLAKLNLILNPLSGKDLEEILTVSYAAPQPILDRAKELVSAK